ncbi:LacI family DNA-binding transcriptional regulator [Paenibacillus agricola]|uniref:LacI family transcriptional regulator n=1 Tax=Paenibacillus agricola TaxID=2716264 RepID=A0ABX0J744_9BACL|nr:LacI family DNA-binding transcriptional regulator [Paenibacillus agricola]NHN30658.1 LacI family transcriptional regulator [Paenibacillus agricola]
MVTRQDVADRAGVSVAVVSYVLNNRKIVKEQTRQKVLDAVRELKYKPNLLARSLKTKKSKQIAVLVQYLGNPFEAGLLLRIESVAKTSGYFVFFQTYEEEQEEQLQELFMGRVDGILLLGQSMKRATLDYFTEMDIPVVSIMEPGELLEQQSFVDIDWMAAMRQLINHLREQGHKRIAFMGGGNLRHYNECRFRAFLAAIASEGLVFHAEDRLDGGGRFENAQECVQRLLANGAGKLPFGALVCANDLMAAGSLAACRELGVPVPEQLAIAGCENILMSSQTNPPLTVIHFPRPEAAELATRSLLAIMDDPTHELASPIKRLEGTLMIRESSGRLDSHPVVN